MLILPPYRYGRQCLPGNHPRLRVAGLEGTFGGNRFHRGSDLALCDWTDHRSLDNPVYFLANATGFAPGIFTGMIVDK